MFDEVSLSIIAEYVPVTDHLACHLAFGHTAENAWILPKDYKKRLWHNHRFLEISRGYIYGPYRPFGLSDVIHRRVRKMNHRVMARCFYVISRAVCNHIIIHNIFQIGLVRQYAKKMVHIFIATYPDEWIAANPSITEWMDRFFWGT